MKAFNLMNGDLMNEAVNWKKRRQERLTGQTVALMAINRKNSGVNSI